jgi:tetratricopeptide (TPR) repeat protein
LLTVQEQLVEAERRTVQKNKAIVGIAMIMGLAISLFSIFQIRQANSARESILGGSKIISEANLVSKLPVREIDILISFFSQVINADKNHARAYRNNDEQQSRKILQEAIEDFDQAIKKSGGADKETLYWSYCFRGIAYSEIGKFQNSLDDLNVVINQLVEREPDIGQYKNVRSYARLNRAKTFASLKQYAKAIEDNQNVINADADGYYTSEAISENDRIYRLQEPNRLHKASSLSEEVKALREKFQNKNIVEPIQTVPAEVDVAPEPPPP